MPLTRPILVVEGNAAVRRIVSRALTARGHTVIEAADGQAAIESMRSRRPSIIMQDLMLPDMDGFQLLRQLRGCPGGQDCVVLAFSGFLSKGDEARISAVGFDDVIIKPIEPGRLVDTVESFLPTDGDDNLAFGAGLRVVVVDDDPIQLKLMRFRLARLGFQVDIADNGAHALQIARGSRPDLIVSDVMMPGIDGFGLSIAIRQEASLSGVPIVLLTSSYVEDADRGLARRAGANDLVLRTPDLAELLLAMRAALDGIQPESPPPETQESFDEFENERAKRVVQQLERQVRLNAGLARRCSSLAAELMVLTGISDAILRHRSVGAVLDETLSACFDAGGIVLGALYLQKAGGLEVRPVGGRGIPIAGIEAFFGHEKLLNRVLQQGAVLTMPAPELPDAVNQEFLSRCGGTGALVVPVEALGTRLGALLMVVQGTDGDQPARVFFAQGVANQIAQAIMLARFVDEREAAERSAMEQERQAREQAAMFRVILDSIGEGVIVVDSNAKVLVWNPAARVIFGESPGRLEREVCNSQGTLLHDDRKTPLKYDELPLIRALKGKESETTIVVCLPGSAERSISCVGRPVPIEGGAPGAVVVFRDVTRERSAAQEILESRAQWQALVENAPDLIMALQLDGTIRFLNRVFPGFDRDKVVGTRWESYVPKRFHERVADALHRAQASAESSTFEVAYREARADSIWFSCHVGPIVQGDVVKGTIIIARDITQKKQDQVQLAVADRMVSIGTLAAGVAHEINNPLAAVVVNLELARNELQNLQPSMTVTTIGEELVDAQEAAERVRQIVADLKMLSRADDDPKLAVDIHAVLDSSLRMAHNELRHRARVVRDFQAQGLVMGNEARLGQVFLNLIMNAAQALPEGNAAAHEVCLTTRNQGNDGIVIDVCDTGEGMTTETMARLFTPFFTTKEVGVGTGLGLPICQKIVQSLGGSIQVKSTLGRGTTFSVSLRRELNQVAPALFVPAAVPRAKRRGRILVVDDEPSIGVVVRRTLGTEHEVFFCELASDAVARLESGEKFDLILCDLMMPQMTGMDVYERLSTSVPEQAAQIVFLTGGAFTKRAQDFLAQSKIPRLDKPFDARQLRTLVNSRVR